MFEFLLFLRHSRGESFLRPILIAISFLDILLDLLNMYEAVEFFTEMHQHFLFGPLVLLLFVIAYIVMLIQDLHILYLETFDDL